MELRHFDYTVDHFRVKETRLAIVLKIYIMQYPAKFTLSPQPIVDLRQDLVRLEQPKMGGEFTATQVRPRMALTISCPTIELIEILAIVIKPRNNLKVRHDYIGYVLEQESRALLAFLFHVNSQISTASPHCGKRSFGRNLFSNFIPAEGSETNWLQNVQTVNHPANLRLPENGFQKTPCGRRSDHVVTHALHFHLGTRETGQIAPTVQSDPVGHSRLLCDQEFRMNSSSFQTKALLCCVRVFIEQEPQTAFILDDGVPLYHFREKSGPNGHNVPLCESTKRKVSWLAVQEAAAHCACLVVVRHQNWYLF